MAYAYASSVSLLDSIDYNSNKLKTQLPLFRSGHTLPRVLIHSSHLRASINMRIAHHNKTYY